MSSTNSPSAMPATVTVAVFRGNLRKPHHPQRYCNGTIFGGNASRARGTERNASKITSAIAANALANDQICVSSNKTCPSISSVALPVTCAETPGGTRFAMRARNRSTIA